MAFTSEPWDQTLARRQSSVADYPELQYSTPTEIAQVDGAFPDRLPTTFSQQAVRLANFGSQPDDPNAPDAAPNVLPWTTSGPLSGAPQPAPSAYGQSYDEGAQPATGGVAGGAGDNGRSPEANIGSFLGGLVGWGNLDPSLQPDSGSPLSQQLRAGQTMAIEQALGSNIPAGSNTLAPLLDQGATTVLDRAVPPVARAARSWMEAADTAIADVQAAQRAASPEAFQFGRMPETDSLFTSGPNGEVVGPTGNVTEMRLGREPQVGEDVNAGLRYTNYGRAQQEALAAEEQSAFRDAGDRAISGANPADSAPPLGGGSGASDAEFARLTQQADAEKAATGSVSAETHDALMNLLGERIGATPTAEQAAAREAFYRDPANLGGGQTLSPEQQANLDALAPRAAQSNTIRDSLANARASEAAPTDALDSVIARNADTLPEPTRTQPPPGYLDRFRQPPAGGADLPGAPQPLTPRGNPSIPTSSVTSQVADRQATAQAIRAAAEKAAASITEKPSLLDQAVDVANAPRAILTSFDLSAPFRQGAMLIGHPRAFFGNLKPMLEAFASKDTAQTIDDAIRSGARGTIKEQAGLYLSPLDETAPLTNREEAYMSRLAGKIPGVAGSQRAYATFLNKTRSDVFDHFWESLPYEAQTAENAQRYAHFVNAATGRGSIPNAVKDLAPALNAAFFSPRYFVSRFESNGMGVQALADVAKGVATRQTLDPVSKQIAGDVLKFYGTGAAALGLAKAAGASVELDPRSSDFGKIKVGDTRYDLWAGNQQIARFIAQEATGQKTSGGTTTAYPRNSTALNFLRSKLGPVPGLAYDTLKGTTPTGDKVDTTPANLRTILFNEFVPMIAQDIIDGAKDAGVVGAAKALPTIVGVGTQTYAPTITGRGTRPTRPTIVRPSRPTRPTR